IKDAGHRTGLEIALGGQLTRRHRAIHLQQREELSVRRAEPEPLRHGVVEQDDRRIEALDRRHDRKSGLVPCFGRQSISPSLVFRSYEIFARPRQSTILRLWPALRKEARR